MKNVQYKSMGYNTDQILNSQKTPIHHLHRPLGVFIVSILENIDHVITAPYYVWFSHVNNTHLDVLLYYSRQHCHPVWDSVLIFLTQQSELGGIHSTLFLGSCHNMGYCTEVLTHWGRDKMDAISQTTFSSAFSWMKMFEFRLKFWSLFLRVQLTIFHHWLR